VKPPRHQACSSCCRGSRIGVNPSAVPAITCCGMQGVIATNLDVVQSTASCCTIFTQVSSHTIVIAPTPTPRRYQLRVYRLLSWTTTCWRESGCCSTLTHSTWWVCKGTAGDIGLVEVGGHSCQMYEGDSGTHHGGGAMRPLGGGLHVQLLV
jgi:hypothetical protein